MGRGSRVRAAQVARGAVRITVWWLATPEATARPSATAGAGPRQPPATRAPTQTTAAAVNTTPPNTSATVAYLKMVREQAKMEAPRSAAIGERVSRRPASASRPTPTAACAALTNDARKAAVPQGTTAWARRTAQVCSG
jgi:hypothetical protein